MSREPLYFRERPTGLVARLFYCFQLPNGTWAAYAHQEASLDDTEQSPPAEVRAALYGTLTQMMGDLMDALHHAQRRAQQSADLVAALAELDEQP